jgi:hypothetical protein
MRRVYFGELNRLGYIEGQNLIVERYSALGQPDRSEWRATKDNPGPLPGDGWGARRRGVAGVSVTA